MSKHFTTNIQHIFRTKKVLGTNLRYIDICTIEIKEPKSMMMFLNWSNIKKRLIYENIDNYSFVTCTPPLNPLSKWPLPLPPAKICAFTTYSFTSKNKKINLFSLKCHCYNLNYPYWICLTQSCHSDQSYKTSEQLHYSYLIKLYSDTLINSNTSSRHCLSKIIKYKQWY